MDGERIIKDIESSNVVDLDWYYHRFIYEEETFTDMLTQGLKCRFLLCQKGFTYNGPFYISLYKNLNPYVDQGHSAYASFSALHPNFIITDINPIKCRNDRDYLKFQNTFLPFRSSGLQDEYQQFWRITPDKFVGLQCSILNWYQMGNSSGLKILRNIIEICKRENISLPIYDFSRCTEDRAHIISTPDYLDLCDTLIGNLKDKSKKLQK